MSIDRRKFFKAMAAGGVAYAMGRTLGTGFSQMTGLRGFDDYKALVCVFLFGGNDSWNTVVPTTAAEYNVYAEARAAGTPYSLAVDRFSLLPLAMPPGSGSYGLHPQMPELRDLFNNGKMAVVPNVGPMVRPTTKTDYLGAKDTGHELPPQLFSHNDQQDQWNSLRGNLLWNTGWAGRIADALAAQTSQQEVPLNISLTGQTLFQASSSVDPYVLGGNGVNNFWALCCGPGPEGRRKAMDRTLEMTVQSTANTYYHRGYAGVQQRALKYADRLTVALGNAPRFSSFVDRGGGLSWLSTQLHTVAKMISQQASLSMTRQIFFVSVGGFDTHDAQLNDHPRLLADLSRSIRSFHDAMSEIGMDQRVTLFTQSDFGRTLTSNGDGSDHGWGGSQFVVGGAVRGGRFYGDYPILEIDGPGDIGSGIILPTESSDQYVATLARWFGVREQAMESVTPHLHNFSVRDLGFMG